MAGHPIFGALLISVQNLQNFGNKNILPQEVSPRSVAHMLKALHPDPDQCKQISIWFRVISAHNKISPCQFRPIAISAHKFCQPGFLQNRLCIIENI